MLEDEEVKKRRVREHRELEHRKRVLSQQAYDRQKNFKAAEHRLQSQERKQQLMDYREQQQKMLSDRAKAIGQSKTGLSPFEANQRRKDRLIITSKKQYEERK